MFKVSSPQDMNQTFARAFNSRDINNLLELYEESAILRIDSEESYVGKGVIEIELQKLLSLPGEMISLNNFCIEFEDIALLRADHSIVNQEGETIFSGSSAEVVRRQSDNSWLYIIDHAMGATLSRRE